MKWKTFTGVLLLAIALLLLPQPLYGPPPTDIRVIMVWNSFAKETRSWVAIRKNTIPVRGRSKMEIEAWERVKEKWALVVLEVEVKPYE